MVRMLGLIAAMLAVLAGGSRAALAQDATPAAGMAENAIFADTMGLPELRVTLSDTGFEGLPTETAAGTYVVTLTNNSAADLGAITFIQLPEGRTVDDLTALTAPPEGAVDGTPPAGMDMGTPMAGMTMGTPATGAEDAGPPPGEDPLAWIYETYISGGPGALAGQTIQAIIDLLAGNYAAFNEDFEAPLAVPVTVTGDATASPMAGSPIPGLTADVTVTEVKTADGYAFEIEGTFAPGGQVVEIYNDADQPHFMEFALSPGPVTVDELLMLFTMDPSTGATPPPGMINPEEIRTAAFAATQSPDARVYLATNLQPGTYILACFIPDPTKEGIPHAFEGMLEVVQVGDAGTPAP